jgi:hypothetical protein
MSEFATRIVLYQPESRSKLGLALSGGGFRPDDVLRAAHNDLAFLAGLYRYALAKQVNRVDWPAIEDQESQTWLWFLPRIMIQLGRSFLLFDLGLRLSGRGREVDDSLGALRRFVTKHLSRDVVKALSAEWSTMRQLTDSFDHSDAGRKGGEFTDALPATAKLWDEFGPARSELWQIWKPWLEPFWEALLTVDRRP